MKWRDDGTYYSFERFYHLKCYKVVGGRTITPEEYIQVLHGKSPLFEFASTRKPGSTFNACLKLSPDKRQVKYHFPDERAPGPETTRPAEFRPDQPKTPTHQEEVDWLRQAMQVPGLHTLPVVVVPYRMLAPNNPTHKEAPKFCPVGILELAVTEALTPEAVKEFSQALAPRVKPLLALAAQLRVKAYVIAMTPSCSQFWICNISDHTPWEAKTTQTMPGFLTLLRRNTT